MTQEVFKKKHTKNMYSETRKQNGGERAGSFVPLSDDIAEFRLACLTPAGTKTIGTQDGLRGRARSEIIPRQHHRLPTNTAQSAADCQRRSKRHYSQRQLRSSETCGNSTITGRSEGQHHTFYLPSLNHAIFILWHDCVFLF